MGSEILKGKERQMEKRQHSKHHAEERRFGYETGKGSDS